MPTQTPQEGLVGGPVISIALMYSVLLCEDPCESQRPARGPAADQGVRPTFSWNCSIEMTGTAYSCRHMLFCTALKSIVLKRAV